MLAQILLSFQWHHLLQPQFYIDNGGLWLLLFIVFAETGLFVGFFLPGDSLLFVAGIYSDNLANYLFNTGSSFINLLMIIALVTAAGILGNTIGFIFGNRFGLRMYQWKDNFLFKKHYLHDAHEFFEKHGGAAVVFARFVPIVRTFVPIVAGIVKMDKKRFQFYNWAGCIAWSASMIASGHYLQKFFLSKYNFDLTKHLETIVLGIVLVTTAPIIIKLFFRKKKNVTEQV